MVVGDVDAGRGLARRAASRPTAPSQLDPAAAVLHYAQEIFEGLKAYRHADGSIWTFRPEANAARSPAAPAAWRCPSCPRRTSSSRCARSSPPTRPGCRPATRARRASTCGRSCSRPRPSSACVRPQRGHLLRHRLPGRRLLLRRPQAGHALALDGLRARRRGRHRRRQVRWQLRLARSPASSRASSTAATRPSSSTPRRTPTSRSSAA